MALLTLTRPPSPQQLALFERWLSDADRVLLSGDARTLLWRPNPTPARGCIRHADALSMGGQPHPDWTVIDDADWVRLSTEHSPLVTW